MKTLLVFALVCFSSVAGAAIPQKAKVLVLDGSKMEDVNISYLDPRQAVLLPAESKYSCSFEYSGPIDVTIGGEKYEKDDTYRGITLTYYKLADGDECRFDDRLMDFLVLRVRHKALRSQLLRIDIAFKRRQITIYRPAGFMSSNPDPFYNRWLASRGEF